MNWIRIERVEGLVIFAVAVCAYAVINSNIGASWWFFALCIAAPDIAMLGYLIDAKWGARIYNCAHTYSAPLIVGAIGYAAGEVYVQLAAIIWLQHIALDRTLGYGLKLETGFKDTHLGRIGPDSLG